MLVQRTSEIDWRWFANVKSVGVTAGASAPEALVQDVIEPFHGKFAVTVETVETATEDIVFRPPKILREPA